MSWPDVHQRRKREAFCLKALWITPSSNDIATFKTTFKSCWFLYAVPLSQNCLRSSRCSVGELRLLVSSFWSSRLAHSQFQSGLHVKVAQAVVWPPTPPASLCSYLAQGIAEPTWAGLMEAEKEFPLYSESREWTEDGGAVMNLTIWSPVSFSVIISNALAEKMERNKMLRLGDFLNVQAFKAASWLHLAPC